MPILVAASCSNVSAFVCFREGSPKAQRTCDVGSRTRMVKPFSGLRTNHSELGTWIAIVEYNLQVQYMSLTTGGNNN